MLTTCHPSHLNAIFTMELLTKEGSPRRLHKAVVAIPHQAGGLITCLRVTKTPRGRHTKIIVMVHIKPNTR
jgi:hypothetical protein